MMAILPEFGRSQPHVLEKYRCFSPCAELTLAHYGKTFEAIKNTESGKKKKKTLPQSQTV